jgi:hypothetical protein
MCHNRVQIAIGDFFFAVGQIFELNESGFKLFGGEVVAQL